MGYAKYVGRVGALAVALGIGAAVATTPGVAWADGEDSPPAADAGAGGGASDPGGATTQSAAHPDPAEAIRNSIERAADNLRDGIRKAVTGVAQSSGGAITSTRRTGSNTRSAAPKTEPPASVDAVNDNPMRGFSPRWHAPQESAALKPVPKPVVKVLDEVKASVQRTLNTVEGQQSRIDTAVSERKVMSTLDVTTAQDAPVGRAPFVAPVRLVTHVLDAALAPFLNTTPGAPAPQNPVLWAVLGWVRRQINETPFGKILLNRPPDITTPDVVENTDGTFTITPSADDFDPDGDRLTYSAGSGQVGTVTPNGTGGFTYTPGEDFGGTDSFTLTASDEGSYPHLHGLASLFDPNGGHTDSVVVNIQSSGSLPAPDVNQDLAPLNDGSGNWVAEFQYDATVSDVHAAFDPKYWRVVTQSYNEDGVYRVELEPTELGKLRAGLNLPTDDELVLQVVKDSTVQTTAFRAAQVAALDVDPPEQAYQISVAPPPAHFEVANSGIQVGSNPAGVVVAEHYAYVANEGSDTVSVIDVDPSDDNPLDPTFNKVVATIPVGDQPFFAGMHGNQLYVVGSDSVSIVNTTNQTVDTITVPPKFSLISIPTNALVSPDGRKLYLLNAQDGNVYVVDVDTTSQEYKSITPIAVGSGFTTVGTPTIDFPISGGFSADGSRLYIVHESIETNDLVHYEFHDGDLVVIDTTTDTVIGNPVDLGQFGGYAASDGDYLYVPSFDSAELSAAYPDGSPPGYVTVVDISSDPDQPAVVDRLQAGALPLNVAFSPDKSLAYVVNAGDGTITVIDTVNNEVLDLDPTTDGVQGIRFTQTPADDIYVKNVIGSTPGGTRLYVTNYTTNSVTALEIVDGLPTESA